MADNQLLKEELAELKCLIYDSKRKCFVPAQKDDSQLSLELETETTNVEAPTAMTLSVVLYRDVSGLEGAVLLIGMD